MTDGPIRFSVRTFRLPAWLTPLLVLLALAMIPVALALALAVMAAALGVGLIRAFLPPGRPPLTKGDPVREGQSRLDPGGDRGGAIDVEYEAKDEDEKEREKP